MRRHLACAAAFLGLLAAPAAAPAKELSRVSVCGTGHRCTTYDKADFGNLMFLAEDAGPADPPAAAAPWYRVRYTVDERAEGGGHDSWTVAYVPAAGRLRATDDGGSYAWVALTPRAAAAFRRAVRDLPAFPAARLRGVAARAPRARDDALTAAAGGTTPRPWLAAGVVAALLILAVAAVIRRRRRAVGVAAPHAGG